VLISRVCEAKEVYGVDISEKGVKMAKRNGIKAFKVNVDEENLPFEDNYFDCVFAGEILDDYRVLKPKGFFILSTPNLAWWINRIALLLGFQPYSMNVSLRVAVYETHNILF